jgi:hypothetical protein
MALTDQEILAALPQLLALYSKIKGGVTDPTTLGVTPPVDPADKTDVALGIAQACNADLMALIRSLMKDIKD